MTKISNITVKNSFLKMETLDIKLHFFALVACHLYIMCKFYALWHHFKSRAKKSYLYFCHQIVFTRQIFEKRTDSHNFFAHFSQRLSC